ncbi:MAG TPA: HoxN/HupN/NixA family nickel/cobalt transporter [Candidatus Eremiobacteraceae bacterium]|nr:HoxN/HupN/NixA family nickel/cobalt transporter [Candidatus Eremiobacteraceae bacterium]
MSSFASVFKPALGKIVSTYAFLLVFNAGAWLAAFAVFGSHPPLLGTALLAYTFGLRHAVDADHIAAIDSVTRRLMHDGAKPVKAGLFFSLGHSTIVVLLTVAIALSADAVRSHIPLLRFDDGVVGPAISALFLLTIAVINVGVLIDVLRAHWRARSGQAYDNGNALSQSVAQGGILGRLFRPVLAMVDKSWKMYPIGVLFGLGFDTATEVGLLGIAAIEAGNALPVAAILIFPLLFAAGMSLLDTTDGILMLGAYGWAFVRPDRKLSYNMIVTVVSIFGALFVGGVEALDLLENRLKLGGGLWPAIASVNGNLGALGCAIVGLFAVSWLTSVLVHRARALVVRTFSS